MTTEGSDERVLLWAPKGRDAQLVIQLLKRHGVYGESVSGLQQLCAELERPLGCLLTSEDEMNSTAQARVLRILARQPAWSDLPIILLGPEVPPRGAAPRELALGNVVALDRPVSARSLLRAVQMALRSRRRQYQARQAIRQRDQFLAMLGHELRNPLAAISFASDSLPTPVNPTVARLQETLRRQVRHLSQLVDDLLDASRVTSGKLKLTLQPLELGPVLERAVQAIEGLAERNGVRVRHARGAGCWVNGDPVRLEQIFSNLLTNAVKYSEPGSEVEVSSGPIGEGCEVVVRDHGLGISADRLESIFDLFEQTSEALDRSQGGLGLGLTLVRRLAEFHGGTVTAESGGLGQGSVFRVKLPALDRALATAGPPPEASSAAPPAPDPQPLLVAAAQGRDSPAPRHRRIVLVEDNADIREATRLILELLGCEVREAADGPAGLREIVERPTDLALVDVGLPGMDGYAVATQVRAASGPRIPLVAMTGYGQKADLERALAAGFDLHLTKPVTLEELEEVVMAGPNAVRGRRARA